MDVFEWEEVLKWGVSLSHTEYIQYRIMDSGVTMHKPGRKEILTRVCVGWLWKQVQRRMTKGMNTVKWRSGFCHFLKRRESDRSGLWKWSHENIAWRGDILIYFDGWINFRELFKELFIVRLAVLKGVVMGLHEIADLMSQLIFNDFYCGIATEDWSVSSISVEYFHNLFRRMPLSMYSILNVSENIRGYV